jgi:hypothetical protein
VRTSLLHALFATLLATTSAVAAPVPAGPHHLVHDPVTHGALTVFPVSDRRSVVAPAEAVTLGAALERGSVTVAEVSTGGSVPTLQVHNRGAVPVFAMAGDVVLGGKQDRILVEDVVLKPGETQDVAVHCVEQGRWHASAAGTSFRYGGRAETHLQRVVRGEQDQSATWATVARLNDQKAERLEALGEDAAAADLRPATGTYRASLEDPSVRKLVDAGVAALVAGLDATPRVVGVVVAVGGKVESFEVYGAVSAWSRDREAVLRSHLLDAMSQDAPIRPAPTTTEAAAVLTDALTASVVSETRKGAAVRKAKEGAHTKVYEVGAEDEEALKTVGYVD